MDIITAQGPLSVGAHKPLPELAGMGHNNPPTPYEALKAHIDDLYEEAVNFLDGDPIATEEQAAAVNKLLDDARKAKAAAEAQRKIEARPFDDGKAEVQALWTPLTKDKTGKCDLIASTAKKALAPWLEAKEAEQQAAAQAAIQEAREKAQAAAEAAAKIAEDDLAGQGELAALQEESVAAQKVAAKAEKAKPLVAGEFRSAGLRNVYTPILVEPKEALRHYMQAQPEALKEWLLDQARRDVRAGKREIPGFTIQHERVAQ